LLGALQIDRARDPAYQTDGEDRGILHLSAEEEMPEECGERHDGCCDDDYKQKQTGGCHG
jgi:hypothetical protein